ncbi:tRNA uridine-5-carboxymethylaminomethyl(34) synthesis enzyme MnmG [Helicobacter muridarum]|uniref:tRNA uridine 5-carboxymethylaminomethyl modification enzyme MnmG n=1 Tax=Helicobacter muridarum TaxID=216 RepID=A0A099U1Z1_9HELI|nr:FAD-dependent oxidoreductase [Helicobacter muridarum]TLE00037.1 tRNA uridine-5-carboxymethylaminomethyl(34) synthesis enzyme MnmG [Helicobacter muridarum]STQ86117.1 glucose inhibited division protein A [Helicobacter muridarum]
MQNHYDIIVIGGGHAGVEASHICAKMGLKTLLITHLIDNIALASCNPAIGGLGKGHLTKEVDSLGGLMGAITDISGLQYRILNASKGPAVRGTRAQIDMDLYRKYVRDFLLQTRNLNIIQANVIRILSNDSRAIGVEISIKKQFFAEKIILTAGTFLSGLIHIGENKSKNGRVGEIASNELSQSLQSLGIPLSRLKTGTCPRILGSSIDSSNLQKHYGDAYADLENKQGDSNQKQAPYFSLLTHDFIHHKKDNIISQFLLSRIKHDRFLPKELPCFVTYTNENTHEIIRSNFYRAPLFTGQIQGVGPRYCPSIEDKINRFSEKERHQLFLEPQTYSASEYYINGLTTSLPYQVQEDVIQSIQGLENAHITRYGYAIEYDYSQPTNLYHTLESKIIKNLYLAGQVNGTTGYEEAAAQGIIAGINASLSLLSQRGKSSRESLILRRDESYIGVMIDDLVTKGTNEPYRVFTSRAEYRLLLREDNACFRMLPYARELGLLDSRIIDSLQKDMDDIQSNLSLLEYRFTPNKQNLDTLAKINEEPFSNPCNLALILGRDSMNTYKMKELHTSLSPLSDRALEQLRITAKYQDYIRKQEEQIIRSKRALSLKIPDNFVYEGISGLSLEVIEKLSLYKPKNLQEASLVSGVTPASLEVLELNIIMHNRQKELL